MTDPAPTSAERAEKLQGMGCKRKRVEDIRFIQGKGSYVDDLKLPGMLYGDFTRSPHAHARIKTIDASKAKAVPGVLAVLTAADLKPLNLHYMPTLAGDVQAVLAEDKVLYQNQEVAFVVADDRYTAADGADLVEVAYEGLPCNVNFFKAMAPDAPVLREDPAGKTEGAHGARKHHNHVFTWQIGDKDATDPPAILGEGGPCDPLKAGLARTQPPNSNGVTATRSAPSNKRSRPPTARTANYPAASAPSEPSTTSRRPDAPLSDASANDLPAQTHTFKIITPDKMSA